MPSLSSHPRRTTTKAMIVGDPGSGKTALLADLANNGFKVHVFDFDHGVDAMVPFLEGDAINNVDFIDLSEDEGNDLSFIRFKKALHEGDPDIADGVPPKQWGEEDVLVVDSLTFASEAAKRVALGKSSKKADDQLSQADWGTAQRLVTAELSFLMSRSISCNVVVLSHMTTIEEDGTGLSKLYPASCGRGISMIVGRFFNNLWRLDTKVRSGEVQRTLRTVSDNRMTLKSSAPHALNKDEKPDLSRIFKIIQKGE